MSFNIDGFRDQIGALMRPNLFQVVITGAPVIDLGDPAMRFYATRTSSPGLQAQTMDDLSEAGVTRNIAHSTLNHNFSVEFLLGEDLVVQNFFEGWYKKVMGLPSSGTFLAQDFSPNFYNDYIGEISIIQFKKNGEKLTKTTLHEAYPVTIGDVALGWDTNNSPAYLNVEFAYLYHTVHHY